MFQFLIRSDLTVPGGNSPQGSEPSALCTCRDVMEQQGNRDTNMKPFLPAIVSFVAEKQR